MRRSGRPLLPVPTEERVSLTALACDVCDVRGCTLVCLWRDERGATEMSFCSVGCARTLGWPWLQSERRAVRRSDWRTRPAA